MGRMNGNEGFTHSGLQKFSHVVDLAFHTGEEKVGASKMMLAQWGRWEQEMLDGPLRPQTCYHEEHKFQVATDFNITKQ